MKYTIQYRNQFGIYLNYQTQNNKTSAHRTAQQRTLSTGKVHRIIDEDGDLVDLYHP